MIIKAMDGHQLEKSKSNSPEAFFNRSQVCLEERSGKERTFSVLYLRYFEEVLRERTAYQLEPLFELENRSFYARDVVALLTLQAYPAYQSRYRVYLNEVDPFIDLFEQIQPNTLQAQLQAFQQHGHIPL